MRKTIIRSAVLAATVGLAVAGATVSPAAAVGEDCRRGTICLYDDGVKTATLTRGTDRDIAFDQVVNRTGRTISVTWYGGFSDSFGYPQNAYGTFRVAPGGSQSLGSHIYQSYADRVR